MGWCPLLFSALLIVAVLCCVRAITDCGRTPIPPNINWDVLRKGNVKIDAGTNAVPFSWPWMAEIRYNGGLLMGGSVIDDKWILTEGRFMKGIDPINITVALGVFDRSIEEPGRVELPVEAIITHPLIGKDQIYSNDITLLKIAGGPIAYTDHIQPVCLYKNTPNFNSDVVYLTGWGEQNCLDLFPDPVSKLRQTRLTMGEWWDCRNAHIYTDPSLHCIAPTTAWPCERDTGGPLAWMNPNSQRWYQVGVLAGIENTEQEHYALFAKPSCDFIAQTTGNEICREFDPVTTVEISTVPPPTTVALPLPDFECGGTPVEPNLDSLEKAKVSKIQGGKTSVPFSWPWMAEIREVSADGKFALVSGGSLLDREWVLTEGWRMNDRNLTDLRVILGEFDRGANEVGTIERHVERIIVHPNIGKPTGLSNDISLIKIAGGPVQFTDHIQPVCLYKTRPSISDDSTYMTGWGSDNCSPDGTTKEVMQLRQTVFVTAPMNQCIPTYTYGDLECSTLANDNSPVCERDMGDPLVWRDPNSQRWFQVGVTTNFQNLNKGSYTLFTRPNCDFINGVVGKQLCRVVDGSKTTAASMAPSTAPASVTQTSSIKLSSATAKAETEDTVTTTKEATTTKPPSTTTAKSDVSTVLVNLFTTAAALAIASALR